MVQPPPVGRSIAAGRALGSTVYVSPRDRSFPPQKDSHRPSAVNSYVRSSFPFRPSVPLTRICLVVHRPTRDGGFGGGSFRLGAPAVRTRTPANREGVTGLLLLLGGPLEGHEH